LWIHADLHVLKVNDVVVPTDQMKEGACKAMIEMWTS